MKERLVPGQLVEICVDGLNYTPDGFATGKKDESGICLFEEIDMFTFPSFDDFHGKKLRVKTGDIATVNKFVGRPIQISEDPKWFSYDIYEIFLEGRFVKAFRQNLRPL